MRRAQNVDTHALKQHRLSHNSPPPPSSFLLVIASDTHLDHESEKWMKNVDFHTAKNVQNTSNTFLFLFLDEFGRYFLSSDHLTVSIGVCKLQYSVEFPFGPMKYGSYNTVLNSHSGHWNTEATTRYWIPVRGIEVQQLQHGFEFLFGTLKCRGYSTVLISYLEHWSTEATIRSWIPIRDNNVRKPQYGVEFLFRALKYRSHNMCWIPI